MVKMSKEAATVLYAMYSQFLSRRKVGQSKQDACGFGSVESIKNDLCPQMSIADVDDAMRELGRCGYLINDYGDETISQCDLTSDAIIDCENLTKDKVKTVVNDFLTLADFLSSLRS